MKKLIFTMCACALLLSATPSKVYRKVIYKTSIECEHCAEKVKENISYVKGVKDLSVDVPTKCVSISFDTLKTDTLRLRKAIEKLGYSASVVSFE